MEMTRVGRDPVAAVLGLVVAALAACHSTPEGAPPPGGTYFTQSTLQYEQNRYRTTNYRRGFVLPVNTKVTLVSMDDAEIVVRILDSGAELTVENVPKHTNDTTLGAFGKLFAAAPADLSRFSEAEQQSIRAGHAQVGMSRNAVLAALGYPPAVGTPSLDEPVWKYWDSRFTTFVVRFDGSGHVVEAGR